MQLEPMALYLLVMIKKIDLRFDFFYLTVSIHFTSNNFCPYINDLMSDYLYMYIFIPQHLRIYTEPQKKRHSVYI